MKCVSKRMLLCVCLMCLCLASGGCITASLATVGTVLGAVGSAASTGADVYKLGKLNAVLTANVEDCHEAATRAAHDLHLRIQIDQRTDDSETIFEMTLIDELQTPVGIRLQRRTSVLTRCRVDVGLFGSEPTSKLVLERIRDYLPAVPPVSKLR